MVDIVDCQPFSNSSSWAAFTLWESMLVMVSPECAEGQSLHDVRTVYIGSRARKRDVV